MSINTLTNKAQMAPLSIPTDKTRGYHSLFKQLLKSFDKDQMTRTAALASLYILVTEERQITARAIALGAESLGIDKTNEKYREIAEKVDQQVYVMGCLEDKTINPDFKEQLDKYVTMIEESLGYMVVTKEPYVLSEPSYKNTNIFGNSVETHLIKGSMWRQMPKYCPELYKAINTLNAQKYRLNQDILNLNINDLDNDQEFIKRQYRLLTSVNLEGELLFSDSFCFKYTLDYRGRGYARSAVVTPQGDSFSKAALTIDTGKMLGKHGLKALAIGYANVCGIKGSFKTKIAWAKKEGLKHARLLKSCGNNWSFIKPLCLDGSFEEYTLALDFLRAHNTPDSSQYVSNVIVHQDATNSGFQFGASILRDNTLAEATNVTGNLKSNDLPKDLYKIMADHMIESLSAAQNSDLNNLVAVMTRKACKKSIMVSGYGAGTVTATTKLLEYLYKDKDNKGAGNPELALPFMTEAYTGTGDFPVSEESMSDLMFHVEHALIKSAPSMIQLTKELQEWVTSLLAADNFKSITWDTPDGFRIVHKHTLKEDTDIGCFKLSTHTNEIDDSHTLTALSPNFIHSIDAYMLRIASIQARQQGVPFVPIHDSFGTLASEFFDLKKILRESFVKTMKYNWIQILSKRNEDLNVTMYNEFDIDEALTSMYMFS